MKTRTKKKPAKTVEHVPRLSDEHPTGGARLKRILFGQPRDLSDRSIFHRLSLIPFLAWVGMGADGLSSSAYGPEEAFRTLGERTYLAVALALAMGTTVLIISSAYSRIIEAFPHGGGGYVVATKLLGPKVGIVSGSALLVDYVLTITVSIAAAGNALFSFVPMHWHAWKLPLEVVAIVGLTVLNIRGVRESVLVLTPIFIVFLITHLLLIVGTIAGHVPELPAVAEAVATGFRQDWHAPNFGLWAMVLLFLHAYSLGGGTFTGIEAVSNGLPLMREPRVQTGKRTMVYMAVSLAFTASGLFICYLLMDVTHEEGKTMNAVLVQRVAGSGALGYSFVVVTMLSAGALLIVAAQAGFIDGPRVLANMAVDSWVPRRFAALSERLTAQNGIVLMGVASLVALWQTRGDLRQLVVMYSINVFVTFSLSMLAMLLMHLKLRAKDRRARRATLLFAVGLALCGTILLITVLEKFGEGGWKTLVVTGALVVLCYLIKGHYKTVSAYFAELDRTLDKVPDTPKPLESPDPGKPTAAVLVAGYGGLGIHTVLNIFKAFPGHYRNLLFISVGVTDSGQFKGEAEMEALRHSTEQTLQKYVELARRLGVPATYRWGIGIDAVEEAERLCRDALREFPKTTFFAGQVIFQLEAWYHRFLHNQTAFAVQKRLQLAGMTMVILPVRVKERRRH